MCTLKNYPYKIEHTIQWSRDVFEGLFTQSVQTLAAYRDDPNYLASLEDKPDVHDESVRQLHAAGGGALRIVRRLHSVGRAAVQKELLRGDSAAGAPVPGDSKGGGVRDREIMLTRMGTNSGVETSYTLRPSSGMKRSERTRDLIG